MDGFIFFKQAGEKMTNQLFTSKEIAKGFLESRFDIENTFDV